MPLDDAHDHESSETSRTNTVTDTLKQTLSDNPHWSWNKIIEHVLEVHALPSVESADATAPTTHRHYRNGKRTHV